MSTGLLLLIVLGLLIVFVIFKYNGIIALRNNRRNAFADIDVQLQQRFDLIPNLANTVKGYASHEQAIYDRIMQARRSYASAPSIDAKIAANAELSGVLQRLFAIAEANPELKANQNFLQMQSDLSDIENKLSAARRFFNSSTKEFNTYIEMFPANLVAKAFGFKPEVFFEPESRDAVAKVPTVEF